MPRKPKQQKITMKRGGWGFVEVGTVIDTKPVHHVIGKHVLDGQRLIVQMDNARDAFGASTRFLWATFPQAEAKAA